MFFFTNKKLKRFYKYGIPMCMNGHCTAQCTLLVSVIFSSRLYMISHSASTNDLADISHLARMSRQQRNPRTDCKSTQ